MTNPTTYKQTLDYLFGRLPMFSRLGKAALKPDLTNTIALCEALGNPQNNFKSIHIAGTNGKGSTSHALAAILAQCGYKTGLYTSPHLIDFRERIRINGVPVPEQWVVDFVLSIKDAIEEVNPSFFEITVAMAFKYFADEGVDIAVVETGLGGRLDSTNIITPLLSIITNISYDHKDLLGNTLAQIASEKAGIIKPHVPVIIGEQHDETERVFFEKAIHEQSRLYYAQTLWDMVKTGRDLKCQYFKAVDKAKMQITELATDLTGQYQVHNIKTVLTAVELLQFQGYQLPQDKVYAALKDVKSLTGLMGRWQLLSEEPIVIADVAHNPSGLGEVLAQWSEVVADTKHIILGFVNDKDVDEALALFPKDATYYFTNAAIPRAMPADHLATKAQEAGLKGATFYTVKEAYNAALAAMGKKDALLITGSFFIVGEVLEVIG